MLLAPSRSSSQRLDNISDSEMNILSQQSCKRKLFSDEVQHSEDAAAETSKRTKAEPALSTSQLKQRAGKLSLNQKAIDWSRTTSTLTATIAFNTYIENCKEPLVDIPDEHLPLIANLAQESDRKLNDLAKDIKSVLSPTSYTGEAAKSASQILTNSSITRAIEKVAERVNYGVTLDEAIAYAANKSLETPDEVPSSLQIWRWEVRDVEHIGSETREFAHARKQERKQARAELDVLLREKPETLAWEKNKPKVKSKDEEAASTSAIKAAESIPEIASKPAKEDVIVIDDDEEDSNAGFVTPSPTKRPVGSAHKESAGSNGSSSRNDSPVKAKKVTKKAGMSPDQLAKEAEKEEKKRIREAKKAEKAAKDAEKEAKKQIEAAKKQREDAKKQREANFFSKFVQPRPRSASPVKAERKDVPTISDFEKVFQACTYKDLAPINQFAGKCSGSTLSADKINSKEDLLADFNSGCRTRHTKRPRKGVNPPISVRDSMRLITEASVMGDEKLEENGKQGLANLSDRRKVPMKLLHFASDRRPAWYGTWTRSSNFVGPRKPLGQDPVALDYSYDSEAEWEDEDPNDGDDVQEVDDKEEEEGGGDDDSEMDDWLVDDLEEEDDDGSLPLDDLDVFGSGAKMEVDIPSPFSRLQPAKPAGVNMLQPKKKKIKPIGRRFEKKLVPFSTGPHWEQVVGESIYEGFVNYQIEFLNDARPGLDPFTFQSTELLPPVEIQMAAPSSVTALKGEQKAAIIVKTASTSSSTAVMTKAQGFPVDQLPALLQAIEGSKSIRPVLLEELKEKFGHLGKVATKAVIEACLNVYAEKTSKKMGAKWVIKEEYRSMAGVSE